MERTQKPGCIHRILLDVSLSEAQHYWITWKDGPIPYFQDKHPSLSLSQPNLNRANPFTRIASKMMLNGTFSYNHANEVVVRVQLIFSSSYHAYTVNCSILSTRVKT